MKEFLGLWLFFTIGFTAASYAIMFGFMGAASFIIYDLAPLRAAVEQSDWLAFRVVLCLAGFFGFCAAQLELDP